MKLKQIPEDFQVEERTDVQPGQSGPFAFYRLEKRSLGTPEAVQAICRKWNIELRRIAYGGLKDRHAVTTQFLTIWTGPHRGLKQSQLHLHYLGQLPHAFGPEFVRGNRFQITLRNLEDDETKSCQAALEEVRRDGVPNYFDDQRFGSVGPSREFVARKLIATDYESALKLALAEPYEFDRAAQKHEKEILRDHWGDWATAKAKLERGHARSIVTYLADHPTAFRGAIGRLRADLKGLYLSAYQSDVWNRMLARYLEQQCRAEQLLSVELRLRPVPMCRHLDDDQRHALQELRLPLPSARLKLPEGDPAKQLIEDVLHEDGLDLAHMKLKHFREPFFSKGDRPAFFLPSELHSDVQDDDRHKRRHKLQLTFELPSGCYATMLIKRITRLPWDGSADENDDDQL